MSAFISTIVVAPYSGVKKARITFKTLVELSMIDVVCIRSPPRNRASLSVMLNRKSGQPVSAPNCREPGNERRKGAGERERIYVWMCEIRTLGVSVGKLSICAYSSLTSYFLGTTTPPIAAVDE